MSQSNHKHLHRLTAFRWISKVNALITRLLEGGHSAIFMGIIDDSVLQQYDTYPYGDWTGAAEVNGRVKSVEDWLDAFIAGKITSHSRVLVVGAGGGKELLAVHEAGGSVSGVEFDNSLFSKTLEMLEKHGLGAEIELRHAERFNLQGERDDFDIVIIPRFYTSFIRSRSERVKFLSACRERLSDDGVIAFDFFIRPESRFSPGALIFKVQPGISNFLRFFRRAKNQRIETGDHLDPQVPLLHHHYNHADLKLELSQAGLVASEQDETWFGWSVAKPLLSKALTKTRLSPTQACVTAPVVENAHS